MELSKTLIRLIENILIVGFVAMIALVFGNVVLRYGFDSGIIQAEELSRVLFVWLTFGGAFLVARQGAHLGMTSIVEKLGVRGKWVCRFLSELGSLFCLMLVIIGSWRQFAINIDNYAPITGIPLAISFLAALVGCLGMAVLTVITLFRLVSGRMRIDEYVVGVESEDLSAVAHPQGDKQS